MDDELKDLLRNRYIPRAPDDLADRIAVRAREMKQKRKRSLFSGVASVFDDFFHLPQPALALMVVFMIGITLGVSGHGLAWGEDLETDDLSSFLVVEDDFIAEEFLEGVSL